MEKFEYYGVILDVYRKYGIRSFPFDIFSLVVRMGYDIRRYANTTPQTYHKLMQISPSACLLARTMFYNDSEPELRVRFSIAHELAHDLLDSDDEELVDTFAGELLAPSPVIRTGRYNTADEVAEAFGISIAAANHAIYRGKRWVGSRLPKDAPEWQLVQWFKGTEQDPAESATARKPKRLPPLLSKEEKAAWPEEKQKVIAKLRRKNRKTKRELADVEGTSNELVRFRLLDEELEFRRIGTE